MGEKKYPKAFQGKVDEYCASFDKLIERGKKIAEEDGKQTLRRLKKEAKAAYDPYAHYPGYGNPDYKVYQSYKIKNLRELIDRKEEIAVMNACAYIRSSYYADELNAIAKAKSDVISENFGMPFGIAITLGIAGLFFKWWVGVILFIVACTSGFSVMMKKNKPKYEEFLALEQDKKAALVYANETVNSLSSDEQDRVQKIGLDLFARYAETQKLRREIAQLKSEIDALSRPSYSSSTSKTTTSGSSGSSGSSGRNEIVDDYGRTQGYSEDGRLYDQKGNVTGYVDEYNRVYDSDHKRVGEVRSDGKIEKYR